MRLYEDVGSILDSDSTVFHLDIDRGSTIENLSILEFQILYGLILDRISCGTITFNKKDIETVITLESRVIHNVISAFMILVNQWNAFAVDTTFVSMLCKAILLKSVPDYKDFSSIILKKCWHFSVQIGRVSARINSNFEQRWEEDKESERGIQ